jgi:hypothetical protein
LSRTPFEAAGTQHPDALVSDYTTQNYQVSSFPEGSLHCAQPAGFFDLGH